MHCNKFIGLQFFEKIKNLTVAISNVYFYQTDPPE